MSGSKHLSVSEFYMWRSLLAIAWADGSCGTEETDYFAKVFDNLSNYYALTAEQRNTLANDLENPQKAETLFPYINEPEAFNNLLCYAEDLVKLDGVVSPTEEDILKRLRLWQHPTYDKEELRKELRAFVAERRRENEEERLEVKKWAAGMHPLYAAVDRLLARVGIDLIE
jgi:hypothetical protein